MRADAVCQVRQCGQVLAPEIGAAEDGPAQDGDIPVLREGSPLFREGVQDRCVILRRIGTVRSCPQQSAVPDLRASVEGEEGGQREGERQRARRARDTLTRN
jgi:hypothetical protein